MIELLIVLGIIVLILGVILASIKLSKAKAADSETRRVLSDLALKIEEQDIAPGVVDYSAAFTSINGEANLANLVTKLNLADADYQYSFSTTEYGIVFPLKKGGYYCIDSMGHATGREVEGLFVDGGPNNCDNATRIVTRPDGWDSFGRGPRDDGGAVDVTPVDSGDGTALPVGGDGGGAQSPINAQ